ncbi:PTS transporter subunit EIIC [Collinsella vaginalis]|uniref:PTS transporter subunit EIIC n=1 Tax=Collinsella vaginalis TaxID=1870987 RepID=UPI000A26FE58|nr:PTS transporter subunit EIIC [Collinsella vaginalis]
MSTQEIAQQILDAVGGPDNIEGLTHCVTRLRFTLVTKDRVDEEAVKAIPGVLGVVDQGGQFQVIIGQTVGAMYDALIQLGAVRADAGKGMVAESGERKGVVNRVLDTIAGIFSPIMPVIAGVGMIKALLSILKLFALIDPESQLYYFLSFIADAGYYFLPIYLAASAARKFRCNMFMSMLLGAMLLHPQFSALGESGDIVSVIGLPVRIVTYSSSVIPILLIIWAYSYVERFVGKIVPSVITFIAKPLLSLLIMAPISFCVLGPLGSVIGDGLVSVLLSIQNVAPWVLPTVIGAFMPFLVMTGMHYSLLPAYVNSLSALGYETIIGPGNLPSNIAQGAAALCVALKTRNRDFRQLAVSSGVTALLGVTEPALFGVNLRLKRPLIAMAIGGGLGGLYAGVTGVLRFGGGGAGLAAIGLYVGPDPMNVINALISCAISFVITFAVMWFIGFEDIPAEQTVDDPMEALGA